MTRQDIMDRIEFLKDLMWYEEMKDYIDWPKYNEWERELKELRKKLNEL